MRSKSNRKRFASYSRRWLRLVFGCIGVICLSLTIVGCGPTGPSAVPVNQTNFQTMVLESDKPVMVDLWAPWCQPCVNIAPEVEQLASDYKGRAIVAKLNVDESEDLADEYEVESIPTFLFFKNGELHDRVVGTLPRTELAARLDEMLDSGE